MEPLPSANKYGFKQIRLNKFNVGVACFLETFPGLTFHFCVRSHRSLIICPAALSPALFGRRNLIYIEKSSPRFALHRAPSIIISVLWKGGDFSKNSKLRQLDCSIDGIFGNWQTLPISDSLLFVFHFEGYSFGVWLFDFLIFALVFSFAGISRAPGSRYRGFLRKLIKRGA